MRASTGHDILGPHWIRYTVAFTDEPIRPVSLGGGCDDVELVVLKMPPKARRAGHSWPRLATSVYWALFVISAVVIWWLLETLGP